MNEQERYQQTWAECLHIIEQNIEPQQFATWFKPIRPVSLENGILKIEVPSEYWREYLESAFIDLLSKTLRRVIGPDAGLEYVVRLVQNQRTVNVPATESVDPMNKPVQLNTFSATGNPGALVYPGLRRVPVNSHLNATYSFANLIKGECNRMGVAAGLDISEKPGKTPFNPLFIFGGPGLGKTHLAQAIGISIREKYPDLVVLYVTGNQFKTQYMNAVGVQNKFTDFMAFYMRIDVLIVDDIQELVGEGNQRAFFNIFNHLHQNGKQLVLTSDRAPKDLINFEERMLSRFKWGLSVELTHPDFSTRLEMLRSRSRRECVEIPDNVLSFIAANVCGNFRELEGALISLIAHATYDKRDFDIELASQVVGNIVGEDKVELTVEKVQGSVCEYFSIPKSDLMSTSRKRQIVQARQIAMYLCRTLIPNCSLSLIGNQMGGKDHSTVLHACTTVTDLMATDRLFRQYVTDIQTSICPIQK